jgi:hypothetical protein
VATSEQTRLCSSYFHDVAAEVIVDLLDVFRIEHHNNIGIRGDSVVLRTAERGRDSRIYFVGNGVDRTCQNLQSVSSFELDVELAVAALEPTHQEVTRAGVRPSRFYIVSELLETRLGKIMRRLLQDVAEGREIGDTQTLTDTDTDTTVLQTISAQVRG